MKKLKLLPTILMLVLCVGVLAIGIYAIKPTQNNISGSITVNASNHPVEIEMIVDGVSFGKSQVVSGLQFEVPKFTFETSGANDVIEVGHHVIVFKIQNKSNSPLGAYFYNDTEASKTILEQDQTSTEGIGANLAKAENILTEKIVCMDGETTVINSILTPYLFIAPQNETDLLDVGEMSIRLYMENFSTTDITNESFTFKLYIEEYVGNVSKTDVDGSCWSFQGDGDSNANLNSIDSLENATVLKTGVAIGKKFVKLKYDSAFTILPALAFYKDTTMQYCVIPSNITGAEWFYMDGYEESATFWGCTSLKWTSVCSLLSSNIYGGYAGGSPFMNNVYFNGGNLVDLQHLLFKYTDNYIVYMNIVEYSSSYNTICSADDTTISANWLILPEMNFGSQPAFELEGGTGGLWTKLIIKAVPGRVSSQLEFDMEWLAMEFILEKIVCDGEIVNTHTDSNTEKIYNFVYGGD